MSSRPAIFVDADACPVKEEVLRVAARHGLPVHMVGNSGMRLARGPDVNIVVVPPEPDAADDWIADRIAAGDIAVTSDIPLAARCLEKGAMALGPAGKPFTADNIGMALSMRALKSQLRETGAIRDGGPAFGRRDRSRFLQALEQAVQTAKRRR